MQQYYSDRFAIQDSRKAKWQSQFRDVVTATLIGYQAFPGTTKHDFNFFFNNPTEEDDPKLVFFLDIFDYTIKKS